jgi:hypothetical protein
VATARVALCTNNLPGALALVAPAWARGRVGAFLWFEYAHATGRPKRCSDWGVTYSQTKTQEMMHEAALMAL